MKKWEYNILNKPQFPTYLQDWLAELGSQGWELCGILTEDILIFKRHVKSERPYTGPR
jgi:hypothetical protein